MRDGVGDAARIESALMKLPPCDIPRIVIVGGGVAGLMLATRFGPRLARMRGRVTLVVMRPTLSPTASNITAAGWCTTSLGWKFGEIGPS